MEEFLLAPFLEGSGRLSKEDVSSRHFSVCLCRCLSVGLCTSASALLCSSGLLSSFPEVGFWALNLHLPSEQGNRSLMAEPFSFSIATQIRLQDQPSVTKGLS